MNRIFFVFLILFTVQTVSCAGIWSNNLYNNSQNYNFSRIEKQIFNETYEYDLPETRLERLETKIFGACQNGTFTDRFNLVKNAAQNYKAYNRAQVYNQYQRPIFTGSTGSNWRNVLWGNFMNQFAGGPTGLTPTITPAMDPAYMDYFEAERAMNNGGDYFDYKTNRGYRTTRTNRGARTGVSILD